MAKLCITQQVSRTLLVQESKLQNDAYRKVLHLLTHCISIDSVFALTTRYVGRLKSAPEDRSYRRWMGAIGDEFSLT